MTSRGRVWIAWMAPIALIACSGGGSGSGAPSGTSGGATAAAPLSSTATSTASPADSGTQTATLTAATTASSTASTTAGAAQAAGCPEGMAKIEGAKFKMGTPDIPGEKPVHEVEVATFCMDRTEVTAAAWEQCVKAGGCKATTNKSAMCSAGKEDRKDHPVNCVDWHRATAFCAWAGKRLPTEEEWEFAAGGVERRMFPWGTKEDNLALCWNAGDRGARGWVATCPVGSYPTGNTPGTGLSDMAGNVEEWTSSFACPYDKSQACDKRWRSVRGGSWYQNTWTGMRSASRGSLSPNDDQFTMGARCAKDL